MIMGIHVNSKNIIKTIIVLVQKLLVQKNPEAGVSNFVIEPTTRNKIMFNDVMYF